LTKSLTCGEGGFCTTNSDKLRDRLDALRNCGRPPAGVPDDWPAIQSGNYRLSEWQAAVLCAQFARFPEQLARRAANAQRLNDALEDVAGMRPMRRPPQVTRQGLYAYVIRYDGHAFAGLLASEFRHALSAELGIDVGSTYEPLNRSPLYQPQTKRRHQLGDQWAQLDPARFDLPIATRAYESESVVIPHEVLLAGWDDLSRLPNAIETVRDRAVHDGESRG
jgi:L-glutamine:2-deoxy-scyllo-inosose/3-amino-2,3-dideoxy-scyllo-inosose aminotransferase